MKASQVEGKPASVMDRRLRIAIDAASLQKPKTGIGEYTANMIRALGRLQDPELVLFYNSFRRRRPDSLIDGLDEARFRTATLRIPARLVSLAWQVIPLPPADWVTGPVDIFHSPNYRIVPVRHAKLVVTVHDLVVLKYPEYQFFTRVKHIGGWLRKLNRADAVVAVSENTRKDILELLDVPPEKVHTVYNGYNADLFRSDLSPEYVEGVLRRYHLGTPYILSLGTLEPRKNLVRLIQAFHLLRKKSPDPIYLVLAGAMGWKYDIIFNEIRRLGLHDSVSYLGYAPDEDLPGLIKGARALAYPSLYEGFGIPPLEAMAVGTPVITSNAASLPEVVGEAGLQVDPEDVGAIAAALERVCGDDALAEDMRAKGLKRAQQFSWDRAARQVMEIYHKLLA
ncbi:MAG: glycosyltransferase family 1 protein [Dehalococcoidia bacterium]